MKFIGGISNIGLGLLIGLFAFMSFEQFFTLNRKLEKYSLLVQNGIVINAKHNNLIQDINTKVKGLEIDISWVEYSFEVNGEVYDGKHFLEPGQNDLKDSIEVRYLVENPNINASDAFETFNELEADKGSNIDLWLGVGSGTLSAVLLLFGLRSVLTFIGS
ncbi:MAG: hypothetical protein JXQ87_17200 [Bacteroidia bacterium]